jgi:hypothetical protein
MRGWLAHLNVEARRVQRFLQIRGELGLGALAVVDDYPHSGNVAIVAARSGARSRRREHQGSGADAAADAL